MKKYFVLFLIIISSVFGFAQTQADDIIGYYFLVDPFSKETSQIYVYRNDDGLYDGKITWVGNKEKEDFVGLIFLKGLSYKTEEQSWEDGKVKYPGKKGTFDIKAKFETPDRLKIRGYWGIAMLGKTMYWEREEVSRENH